jgi:hypothetical protein
MTTHQDNGRSPDSTKSGHSAARMADHQDLDVAMAEEEAICRPDITI